MTHERSKDRNRASLGALAIAAALSLALIAPGIGQASSRDHDRAVAEVSKKSKKKGKKKKRNSTGPSGPVVPTPAPTPLALTYGEALNAAMSRAYQEYVIDDFADDYGVDGCVAMSAYRYDCLAWNHEYYPGDGPYWCDWIESVVRTGISGVSSSRITGFDCYPDL